MKLFWWAQYKQLMEKSKMIVKACAHEDEWIKSILDVYALGGYTKIEAEKEVLEALLQLTEVDESLSHK